MLCLTMFKDIIYDIPVVKATSLHEKTYNIGP
jgi:hypothetical protein